MDKTIEVLLVAMIALIAAVIVVSLMTGQTDSFSGFLNEQQQGAECELAISQVESCNANPDDDYPDMDNSKCPGWGEAEEVYTDKCQDVSGQ